MLLRVPVSIVLGIVLCSQSSHSSENDLEVAQTQHTIEQALDENRDAIMALPDIVGTGISMCGSERCIKVLVSKDSPELRQQLDQILGEHPYVVEQTDTIRPLPAETDEP